MRRIVAALAGLVVTILLAPAGAQSPPYPVSSFGCVANSSCAGSSLESYSSSALAQGTVVSVAGYNSTGDLGGGNYVVLGQQPNVCNEFMSTSTNTSGNVGKTAIFFTGVPTYPTNLTVGELVSGLGSDGTGTIQVQTGSEIASITKSGTNITQINITLPMTGTATDAPNINLTITGSNGGTLITDSYNLTDGANCYQKTDYHGDPHEFGAFGNGKKTQDDGPPLQAWLGSLGPWDATVPANYYTDEPLTCGPGVNLRAPANGGLGGGGNPPIVQIAAGPSFPAGTAATHNAVITAWATCRISGIGIEALVNEDAGSYNDYVDAVIVGPTNAGTSYAAYNVVIDDHTLLADGYYNLYCGPTNGGVGLQLKDAEFAGSWSDNVSVQCSNVRMIGDIFNMAGADFKTNIGATPPSQAGVHFLSDDLTLMGGVAESVDGPGISIEGAHNVSVTGMYFDENGETTDSPAVLISSSTTNPVHTISICGNHFHENDWDSGAAGLATAHVRFYTPPTDPTSANDVDLCGNVYLIWNKGGSRVAYPNYVYDVVGAAPTNVNLYENAVPQISGVFSPAAAADLPQSLVAPGPRAFITGLTLMNDSGAVNSTIDIQPGVATDSTGVSLIQNTSVCKVDLTTNGLKGLDTGSLSSATTYFFFVVADEAPTTTGTGTATPSCMASTSQTPNFAANTHYGYPVYRLVGALYTTNTTPTSLITFYQDNDTFYLGSSVMDIKTGITGPLCTTGVGTSPTSCALSVPCGRIAPTCSTGFKVNAFGRVVGGSSGEFLISSLDQSAQSPTVFAAGPPGYSTTSSGATSAHPFKLYTDGSGNVRVQASTTGNTVYEVTDGWVWPRQQ